MEELTDKIIEVLEYMNLENIKRLRKTNYEEFRKHIITKYSDFEYFSILKLLIDNEGVDINKLIDMIKMANDIRQNNISQEDANEILKEDLANEYIYPKFGGKKQFEKEMIEEGKRKKLI